MPLVLVTPPAGPVVSLDEAKAHLRIDGTDEDAYVTALVAAATATVDGAGGWLGRALRPQVWDLTLPGWPLDRWCERIRLPLPPLISVASVSYRDGDGITQTLATGDYVVSGVGAAFGGAVSPADGASWPSLRWHPEAVTVRFTAGYAEPDDAVTVPEPIRHAILMMVGHLYANREAVAPNGRADVVPMGAEALLAPYRVFA